MELPSMVSPEFSTKFPSFFPHPPRATYVEPYYAVILKWIPAVPILYQSKLCLGIVRRLR